MQHSGDATSSQITSGFLVIIIIIIIIKDLILQEQFPRNFFLANVTKKSRTCYKDVAHVGRVTVMLRGCYEETAAVEFSINWA